MSQAHDADCPLVAHVPFALVVYSEETVDGMTVAGPVAQEHRGFRDRVPGDALFQHLSVDRNVRLGLGCMARIEQDLRVSELLRRVELDSLVLDTRTS